MNTLELRELDAWIAEHVMKFKETQEPDDYTADSMSQWYKHTAYGQYEWRVIVSTPYECKHHPEGKPFQHSWKNFKPAADPAAAMEVLKKCLDEKTIFISHGTTGFWIADCDKKSCYQTGQTLELTICQFAKKLFTK